MWSSPLGKIVKNGSVKALKEEHNFEKGKKIHKRKENAEYGTKIRDIFNFHQKIEEDVEEGEGGLNNFEILTKYTPLRIWSANV